MENHLNRKTSLTNFWKAQGEKKSIIDGFTNTIESLNWGSINEVKADIPSVSIIKNNRLVFNIKGRKYRLIATVIFIQNRCYIFPEWMGTHAEYTKICKANLQHTTTNYKDYT